MIDPHGIFAAALFVGYYMRNRWPEASMWVFVFSVLGWSAIPLV